MGDKNKIIYLLLGLGIGLIISNVLHRIYPQIQYIDLSDDQIIEQAMDLGMVKLKDNIKLERDSQVSGKKEAKQDKVDEELRKEEEENLEVKKEEKIELAKIEEVIVYAGYSLTTVANELYDKKIIEDVDEFIVFVKDKKLDKRILTGKHKIRQKSSYEEIIKILTDRDYLPNDDIGK